MLDGHVTGDLALLEQGDQGGIHQVVALSTGGGDGIGDLRSLALPAAFLPPGKSGAEGAFHRSDAHPVPADEGF